MLIKKVNFSEIRVGQEFENVRSDLGDIDALVTSIREEGLKQPMTVWRRKTADGHTYDLIAGFRRYTAISQIRQTTPESFDRISVSVVTGNRLDAEFSHLAENLERKDLTAFEKLVGIRRLKNLGLTVEDIARRMGRSPAHIYGIIKLGENATPEVQQAVVDGDVPATVASHIASLPPETQETALATYAEVRDSEGAMEAAQTVARAAGKRKRATEKQVRAEYRRLMGMYLKNRDRPLQVIPQWEAAIAALSWALGETGLPFDEAGDASWEFDPDGKLTIIDTVPDID